MKTNFTTAAALCLGLMVAACGGNASQNAENVENAEKVNTEKVKKLLKDLSYDEKGTEEAANMCLEEGFKIDAEFADWKPSYEIITDKTGFHGDATLVSYTAIAVYPKAGEGDAMKVTDEEIHEVVRKVYTATAAVAEGGINIYGFEKFDNKEEAEKEFPLDELVAQTGIFADYAWRFKQDGKIRGARVEIKNVYQGKENAIRIEIYTTALQKSFNSTMNDVDKALDDPNVKKVFDKAVKD